MKRLILILLAIPIVLLAIVVTVAFFIPSSVYKAEMETAASNALQRDVTLNGDPKLSIFPTLAASIAGFEVSNPDDFEQDKMIEAGEFHASLKFLPLLFGRVEVNQITLTDATISLERLADGRANWEFTDGADQPAPESPNGEDETPANEATAGPIIAYASLTNAAISYIDRTEGTQISVEDLNLQLYLPDWSAPLTATGDGRLEGYRFELDTEVNSLDLLLTEKPAEIVADIVTDLGRASFTGTLELSEASSIDGKFQVDSTDISLLTGLIGDFVPVAFEKIKSVSVSGSATGSLEAPQIELETVDVTAPNAKLDFSGAITDVFAPAMTGSIEMSGTGLTGLLSDPTLVPYGPEVTGSIDLTSNVSLTGETISLSDLRMTQASSFSALNFVGSIRIDDQIRPTGNLSASSKDMSGLLAKLSGGSPEDFPLQTGEFSGSLSGDLSELRFSDTDIALDDIKATGRLSVNLSQLRPAINATLNAGDLDLGPYLVAERPTGSASQVEATLDWDDTPFDLTALKDVDINAFVTASRIDLDTFDLTDATVKADLKAGALDIEFDTQSDKPGFSAFDGQWVGLMRLDVSEPTPKFSLEATADGLAADKFLAAFTGISAVTGLGEMKIDLSSEGSSLKQLIAGLDGTLNSDVDQGAVKGINLAKLVRDATNLTKLLQSGGLTADGFQDAFSPESETDFSRLLGNLSFSQGVARIEKFSLDNPVVGVSAGGQIDLLNQTFDISLSPSIDVNAAGQGRGLALDNIPVPVRIYGDWLAPKYALDTQAVQAELTLRARNALESELRDQVSNGLNQILGGGGTSDPDPEQVPTAETEGTGSTEPETAEAPEPSIEDQIKDRVKDEVFDRLFGNEKSEPAEPVDAPND